jgi:hypothetical protein
MDDPPQVTQLLGELEGGSETADRLPVLAECRLSLSQVNERGDSRAGILLSLVGGGGAAPARNGVFEGAAGEGLGTLIEERSGRGFIRRQRGERRQQEDRAEEGDRRQRQRAGGSREPPSNQ